ncbi:MAG: uroporphyrinogen-III synthase [Candidatus Puniceispirillaceae bacterium]
MLAILRPEPAGTQDVNTLSAMGIPAMSLPMLEIAPCLPADITTQIAQADHLVFTSPAAIAAIMARDGLESVVAGKACFCVGTATAQAAKQAGLIPFDTSAGNAGALAKKSSLKCAAITHRQMRPACYGYLQKRWRAIWWLCWQRTISGWSGR